MGGGGAEAPELGLLAGAWGRGVTVDGAPGQILQGRQHGLGRQLSALQAQQAHRRRVGLCPATAVVDRHQGLLELVHHRPQAQRHRLLAQPLAHG